VSFVWNPIPWVNCQTELKRFFRLWLLTAVFSVSSCSGLPHPKGPSGGPGSDAALVVTLRAIPLVPSLNTNLLSFSATVVGISLTPSTGGSLNVPLNSTSYQTDLTKLQSDTAFLARSAAIPPGTYTNMVVSLADPAVTYCTQTQGATGCAPGSLKTLNGGPAALVLTTVPFPLMLVPGQTTGLAIIFNLANALTVNSQTQVISGVNLGAPDVVTAKVLPPASSTLPPGTLDFVEDVTGVVSSVDPVAKTLTVQTATRGSITASEVSSTILSPNCTIFNLGTTFTCAKQGQVASLDTILNADGTFSLLEYDPLATEAGDWIEGIVARSPFSSTQFELIANDLVLAPSDSLIGSNLGLGEPVSLNLINPKPFVVDSKGLTVPNSGFSGATDASILQPGETLALHVVAFTPASPTTLATASVDFVYLRFTRVSGVVAVPAPPNTFAMQSFPPFFGLTLPVTVQLSNGSPSTRFDGINGPSSLVSGQTVAIGALYFGSTTGPTPTPTPLSAAKARVP